MGRAQRGSGRDDDAGGWPGWGPGARSRAAALAAGPAAVGAVLRELFLPPGASQQGAADCLRVSRRAAGSDGRREASAKAQAGTGASSQPCPRVQGHHPARCLLPLLLVVPSGIAQSLT